MYTLNILTKFSITRGKLESHCVPVAYMTFFLGSLKRTLLTRFIIFSTRRIRNSRNRFWKFHSKRPSAGLKFAKNCIARSHVPPQAHHWSSTLEFSADALPVRKKAQSARSPRRLATKYPGALTHARSYREPLEGPTSSPLALPAVARLRR